MSNIVSIPVSQHYHFPAGTHGLVQEIKTDLHRADTTYAKADHYRVRAALMLAELRERVTTEGENWWPWAERHFANVSRSTLERLLKIADAESPEAVVGEQTRRNRIYKQKQRANLRLTVSGKSEVVKLPARKQKNLIGRALALIESMTDQERDEFKTEWKERWQW